MAKYQGITHFVPSRLLGLWKRILCKINIHAFDEVDSLTGHYLHCDACGLVVGINYIEIDGSLDKAQTCKNQIPSSGQFVAVWVFDGLIWSDTFKWIDGKLYVYSDDRDDFIHANGYEDVLSSVDCRFYCN